MFKILSDGTGLVQSTRQRLAEAGRGLLVGSAGWLPLPRACPLSCRPPRPPCYGRNCWLTEDLPQRQVRAPPRAPRRRGKQTDRQTDRQTDKRTDRPTDHSLVYTRQTTRRRTPHSEATCWERRAGRQPNRRAGPPACIAARRAWCMSGSAEGRTTARNRNG